VSLTAVIGVGLGGLIRHTAGAATTLALIIVGGLTVGQFLPAGWRQYMPGIATQAAVTVHRSAGLLRPGLALAVLGGYAAIALTAASLRASRRDAEVLLRVHAACPTRCAWRDTESGRPRPPCQAGRSRGGSRRSAWT
jgi:hypothetical protein